MLFHALLHVLILAAPLPSWNFAAEDAAIAWHPNAHVEDVALSDGALQARGAGSDPFFVIDSLDFPATARQSVRLRIAADRPGRGELFWTGTSEGPYGGLSQEKSVTFQVPGGGTVHDVIIHPFWQREAHIVKMRLDLYDGAAFRIEAFAVHETTETVPAGETVWHFGEALPQGWTRGPNARTCWGMLQGLHADEHGWVGLKVSADHDAAVEVRWASAGAVGYQTLQAPVRAGEEQWYNVEVQGEPTWQGEIVGLGVQVPPGVTLETIQLSNRPMGPPRIVVNYLGPEDGVNRAGREVSVLARLENLGGESGRVENISFTVPDGLTLIAEPEPRGAVVAPGARHDLRWTLRAASPGTHDLTLHGEDLKARTVLRVLPDPARKTADYVPPPMPVETEMDICAYYFPGWGRDAAWEPIRSAAPGRKPVLGWYDERKVEVVDWQIKWAVENGISCFLVDWYWVAGSQHLTHWFEAYRQARYRDHLQVAIMWANHNPPGSHSMGDWRAVTQEWIERYFNLPTYYHVDGMPALFFWSPANLRNDLGGSEAVAEALAMSQEMARNAGHKGIAFIAMFDHDSPDRAARLAQEGYYGATNYHEFGDATHMGDMPKHFRFADVVATSPQVWRRKEADSGALKYFPVADTGWDARPWHGAKAQVFSGRTPEQWERLLGDLKHFAVEEKKPFVVLGPVNEWGEGSYIEPAAEYDFAMYEAIRRVFGKGTPAAWPVNIAPADVGLGPYHFKMCPVATAWEFDEDHGDWAALMGMGEVTIGNGMLRCQSATNDAALRGPVIKLDAARYPALEVRIRLSGLDGPDTMQLFWSDGGGTSEAQSIRIPILDDGWRTHRIDLSEHPRWRGTITGLRLDPTVRRGVTVEIDRIAFAESEE